MEWARVLGSFGGFVDCFVVAALVLELSSDALLDVEDLRTRTRAPELVFRTFSPLTVVMTRFVRLLLTMLGGGLGLSRSRWCWELLLLLYSGLVGGNLVDGLERSRFSPPVRPECKVGVGASSIRESSSTGRCAAVRSSSSMWPRLRFLSVDLRWEPSSS